MNLQLKPIRQSKDLSQEDMANKLSELMKAEIKVSRYGTWERGDRMMNLEQAYYCAVALDCTLNDLVGMKSRDGSDLDQDERYLVDTHRAVTVHGKRALMTNARAVRAEYLPKVIPKAGPPLNAAEMALCKQATRPAHPV